MNQQRAAGAVVQPRVDNAAPITLMTKTENESMPSPEPGVNQAGIGQHAHKAPSGVLATSGEHEHDQAEQVRPQCAADLLPQQPKLRDYVRRLQAPLESRAGMALGSRQHRRVIEGRHPFG